MKGQGCKEKWAYTADIYCSHSNPQPFSIFHACQSIGIPANGSRLARKLPRIFFSSAGFIKANGIYKRKGTTFAIYKVAISNTKVDGSNSDRVKYSVSCHGCNNNGRA